MNIFEFAIEKEKFAEQYYRQLAERENHTGLKSILTMLAEEEAKHLQAIENIKATTPLPITDTPVLKNAKAVFTKIKKAAETFSFDISEVDLYRKACEIESQSKKYYLQKATEVTDQKQTELFEKLAEEENKHLMLVQSLSDFVAMPETYLENAEFNHFDNYVEGEF